MSRRIQALENELGVSLFERDATGVRLTVAGRRFLGRVRVAFADIDNAVRSAGAAGRGAEGVIRIGIFPSMISGFLGELLNDFRTSHPAIALDFVEGSQRQHIANIFERRLDIAFVIEPPYAPGLDAETFWTERIFVALPVSHPLAGCESVDWEYLTDERFILGAGATSAELYDRLAKGIGSTGRALFVQYCEVCHDTLMQLVALGVGVSFVADLNVGRRYSEVAFRPLANQVDDLSYCALWLPGNDNPALRRLLSLARAKSAERRSQSSSESTP